MSKLFCIQTYRQARDQINKDFEFRQKDRETQQRVDTFNQTKLAEMREKNKEKAVILSKNINIVNKLHEDRIQQIKDRLNRHNINLNKTQLSSTKTLPLTTYSPSLNQTQFILTQHRNRLERLRKTYENETHKKLAIYTRRREDYFNQIKNKSSIHNTIVNDKMIEHIGVKSIGTDDLKNELDLQESKRLNMHNEYLYNKYNSICAYAKARHLRGVEVRKRKRGMIEKCESEIIKVAHDAMIGSYEDRLPPNYFQLTQNQLKRIDRRREAKERKEGIDREEAKKKIETDAKTLNDELHKFYKIMAREKRNEDIREKILIKTIRKQEEEDYNLEQTLRKLEKLKNKSIYKNDN